MYTTGNNTITMATIFPHFWQWFVQKLLLQWHRTVTTGMRSYLGWPEWVTLHLCPHKGVWCSL